MVTFSIYVRLPVAQPRFNADQYAEEKPAQAYYRLALQANKPAQAKGEQLRRRRNPLVLSFDLLYKNPMAALSSSSSLASVSLASHASASVVTPRRRGNNPVSTTSPLPRPSLTGLMLNSSDMNNALPIKRRDTRVSAVDPGTPPGPDPLGRNLPIPGLPGIPVPQWAQWLVGAIFFAVPLYRQFRAMEDKIEKTAEVAIEVIDMVAEETEKIADEVADSMPGNKTLKAAAAKIKAVADEIEEDADKAKALIDKAEEIDKEMDSIVDSLIDNKKGGKKKP